MKGVVKRAVTGGVRSLMQVRSISMNEHVLPRKVELG